MPRFLCDAMGVILVVSFVFSVYFFYFLALICMLRVADVYAGAL